MSGIITGPYFKAYFNDPGPGKLGAMVSILEIGAFGVLNYFTKFTWANTGCSHVPGVWASRRSHWSKDDFVLGCSRVYNRRGHTNIREWVFDDGNRTNSERFWRRLAFVSAH